MPATRMTRDERRAQTVERLLDAAAVVFAQKGFASASVDDVAEAAGFTKGAVYSNFESKEALFLAVLDRHDQRQVAALDRILHSAPTLHERMEALGGWFAELFEAEREWSLLAAEFALYAARNPGLRDELAKRQRAMIDTIAGVIDQQAHELGLALPASPPMLASAILATGDGISLRRLVDPDIAPPGLFRDAIALLLGQPGA